MTKGARTSLFLIAATLFNLLLTGALFVALLLLYNATLGKVLQVASSGIVIMVLFLVSLALAGLAYNLALKRLRERWNLEEKLGMRKGE